MGVAPSSGGEQNHQPQNISSEQTNASSGNTPTANTANASTLNSILQSSEQVASVFSEQEFSVEDSQETSDTGSDTADVSAHSDSDQPIDRDGGGSGGNGGGSRDSQSESYTTTSTSEVDNSSAKVTTSSVDTDVTTTSTTSTTSTASTDSTTTSTTSTSSTSSTTDPGTTDPDAPVTETSGPAPIAHKDEEEEIPTIKANTSAYVNSSIVQKTQQELGELSDTLHALSNSAAKNDLGLSDRSAALSSFHFQTASNAIGQTGQEETAYVNLVAGYSTAFSEVLTTPGGLEAALGSTLTADEAKRTADVFTKVLSGEYGLPNAATLEAAEQNSTASGQGSVSSSTVANILGAFAADVTMNEVNLAEYASTTSQVSADIGQTSLDVAQGQLDNLQDQIDKIEKQQKKASKMGKLTQGLTVAALAVGIVVMTAVVVGTAGGATPLALVTIGIMAGALAATVADMSTNSDRSSIDVAMTQMANVVQMAGNSMGANISDNDAKMIAAATLAIILGAATGGVASMGATATIGGSLLAASAITLTTLSTVNFWGTAGEEMAKDLNLSDKDAMILTLALTIAAMLLTMGVGIAAGGAAGASTTDDFAGATDDGVKAGTEGAKAGGKGAELSQASTKTAVKSTELGKNSDEVTQGGIEMTTLKSSGSTVQSTDDTVQGTDETVQMTDEVVQESDEVAGTIKSASELSEAGKLNNARLINLSEQTANNLSKFGSFMNVAAAGAQAASGIMQGELLQERAKLALEQADTEALTTIMHSVNQTQLALSSSVIENYASAVEGLGASTSSFLQNSAAGAQELAKVLGEAA